MYNIDYYYPDGALGLGLFDNFYSDHLKKKNIEFFEDFDDGNKPANDFAIYLDDVYLLNKSKKAYNLFFGFDDTESLVSEVYNWFYVPKNK